MQSLLKSGLFRIRLRYMQARSHWIENMPFAWWEMLGPGIVLVLALITLPSCATQRPQVVQVPCPPIKFTESLLAPPPTLDLIPSTLRSNPDVPKPPSN